MTKIITQFIEEINSLSKRIYILTTTLEPILIDSCISDEYINEVENICINNNVNILNDEIGKLNSKFEYFISLIKQKNFRDPNGQGYASFIVDEQPIIIDENEKRNKKKEVSFSQLNDEYFFKKGTYISPIKRTVQLEYKGNCAYCDAPNNIFILMVLIDLCVSVVKINLVII